MLTVEDGWLAGILEGEGTIFVIKRHDGRSDTLRVAVKMVDEDIVARVASMLDRSYRAEPVRQEGWQDQFKTEISGRPAAELLVRLYPLFGERRRAKIDEVRVAHSI